MKYIFWLCLLGCTSAAIAQDETAYFVQVASYRNPQYKDFSKIHSIGYLFEMPSPNGLPRIIMGTFSSQGAATQALRRIKEQGYKDAFVQKAEILSEDGVYVVQLGSYRFEQAIDWGAYKKMAGNALYAQMSDQKVRVLMGTYDNEDKADKALAKLQNQAPQGAQVRRVSRKVIHKVTTFEMARSAQQHSTTSSPRPSVKALQQLLTKEGFYKDGADGVWGKGTSAACVKFQKEDSRYPSYQSRAEKLKLPAAEPYSLQYYIDLIPDKPELAEKGLAQFQHPLAKVYLAYMYLNGDVQKANYQSLVNELMNTACEQVFTNYQLPTRSNFRMDYAYRDMNQLILHLREIHEAVKDEPAVPCWLFKRHPDAMEDAFAPHWNSERDAYSISDDCGSFLSMPSFKALISISQDFSNNPEAAANKTDYSALNRIFAMPVAPDKNTAQQLEDWQIALWSKYKNWASGTALQRGTYKNLEFAFLYTQVGLEDYFIEQGFVAKDARSLALQVLNIAIHPYFD